MDIERKTLKKYPKRLRSPLEMLKYFISHTSLHGIKYSQDVQLYKLERVIWLFLVISGFYFAIKTIIRLYGKFQASKTEILIDEIHYDIFHVPFPSVTYCPGSRVDWIKATELSKSLIPADNEEANYIFLKLLRKMSTLRFSHLSELEFNATNSTRELLNGLNITDILMKVMPSCEQLIFNCSWSFSDKDCCDIFERQRTANGFCYTFNSLVSIENKHQEAYKAHGYGFRSGLKFIVKKDNLNFPPDFENDDLSIFKLSHPRIYPSKARVISFGYRYNVDVKFTSAYASPDVLALENLNHPPCRYEKGLYKLENCITYCQQKYFHKMCGCNPGFFFQPVDETRECNITDLQCVSRENEHISEVHYSMISKGPNIIKSMCDCPPECEYCTYDDYVIGIPFERNSILIDIHYDGPTGVRYKRGIVVSNLDMLVQLGGIFGLFLGGSLLTLMEMLYCFIIGVIFYIYQCLRLKRKTKKIKTQQIHVLSSNDKTTSPLFDYTTIYKQNRLRY